MELTRLENLTSEKLIEVLRKNISIKNDIENTYLNMTMDFLEDHCCFNWENYTLKKVGRVQTIEKIVDNETFINDLITLGLYSDNFKFSYELTKIVLTKEKNNPMIIEDLRQEYNFLIDKYGNGKIHITEFPSIVEGYVFEKYIVDERLEVYKLV